ncbi:MAG: tRNA (adenosine(37)-N6)-threonylcarbamoyltransferase complex transferase subunit TsaD, partial [Miltoncostaeaceae bacterium]
MSDLVLAIETSCDETAAAVVEGRAIRSNVIASQADLHAVYGGVVPEVAARHHLTTVNAVVDEALDQAGVDLVEVDRIAVTRRPGLIGALLVGVATAKALAYAARKGLVMVDHLHGHVAACWLDPVALDPPFVALTA